MARKRGKRGTLLPDKEGGVLNGVIQPRRVMRFNMDTGMYEYVNVIAPVGPGTVPVEPPKAQPAGRMKTVNLGEIAKIYEYGKIKIIDFRTPLIGEWFLQKASRKASLKVARADAIMTGKRLIFEVEE
jgi:hypothetical protein